MTHRGTRWLSARRRALGATSLAVLSLGMGGTAFAQQAAPAPAGEEAAPAVQEVVVTGSRIAKRDFTSSSPIVTVNAQALENSSNVALEANLNKLPQFTPAQNLTGVNSQDVQPTATNSVGAATLSLRGLGPNRNLVLIDGRRMQPINGLNVVDLNTIPAAMVDHVEVITGGASAVYGADAVGGVVNFILKKNFRGVDMDAQYGVTEAGDGQEFKISALLGTDFADGKGNVMFGLEHYTRGASYQRNRSFYTDSWNDPSVATNEFFFTGAAFNPSVLNAPSQSVVDSIFSGRAAGTTVPSSGIQFYFNPDGTVFTGATSGFGANGAAGAYRFQGTLDGVRYGPRDVIDAYSGGKVTQAVKSTQTNYFVTSPASRWSINGAAHYDFSDYVSTYIQGLFAQTKTETVLFPSPFITGWGVNIPRDGAHPVSPELTALLDSRPDPTAPWELYLIPDPSAWMPARGTHDTNTVWQMTLGFNGKVPNTDLTWDIYGSHGNAEAYSIGDGYASLSRYQALLTSPNYGAGQTITGNQGAPNFGFGAASVHCTSGFYSAIFEGGTPSKDCVDAITAHLQNTTLTSQDVVEGTIQGGLFQLPAGQLRFSLGGSYRENNVQYNPDVLQSTSSFTDQVVGVYPTAYMNASTSAKEGFGELLIPVVTDLPFVKSFDLELGARYSSYGAVDRINNIHVSPPGGWTYKILGDWAINDWLRVRGGYNLAVRSPNVGELFLGKQEVYAAGAATAYGDPCSYASSAPFGAGGAGVDPVTGATYNVVNANGLTGAQNALAICRGLMGATGSSVFYAQQQAPGAPSPFGFVYQQGNPDLNSEKARTWTAGLVIRSPVEQPLLSRLSASIDWYKISVNGAIEFQSVDDVKQACLSQDASTAAALSAALASPECQLLSRNSGTGAEAPTTISFDNLATIKTSGVDVQVNWAADFADMGLNSVPGGLNLNVLVNWLDYFDTVSAPGQPVRHWAGTLGPNLNGTNPGAFKWKLNTTLTYNYGPASLSLNWRHLPKVHSQTYGQPGDNTLDTAAHDEFGLYGTWELNRNYILRAGVDNLLDARPEITGANTGIPGFSLATSGRGTTMEGLYDALGRRYYVGIKAKF
jgi:outer membrane receptor protein involved in Fe transport